MSQQVPEHEGALVLPFSKEDFGAFVSGLLGKPQEIESTVPGVFTLTLADVISTYHLVNQRVGQQSECAFVQFTVRDRLRRPGSSVLLNSLEALGRSHLDGDAG